MANSKKPEAVAIQIDITQEKDWKEAMKKPGLLVVDVHQGWCGPCVAMQSVLKKLKLDLGDLGDNLLHFAVANADEMNLLEEYKGNCEPTWLFYAKGEFVGVLKGTNAPLMNAVIKELLEIEQQYMNGQLSHRKLSRIQLYMKSTPREVEEHPMLLEYDGFIAERSQGCRIRIQNLTVTDVVEALQGKK